MVPSNRWSMYIVTAPPCSTWINLALATFINVGLFLQSTIILFQSVILFKSPYTNQFSGIHNNILYSIRILGNHGNKWLTSNLNAFGQILTSYKRKLIINIIFYDQIQPQLYLVSQIYLVFLQSASLAPMNLLYFSYTS